MACCLQATIHYPSQCWQRSLLPYGVARPQWVNTICRIIISIWVSNTTTEKAFHRQNRATSLEMAIKSNTISHAWIKSGKYHLATTLDCITRTLFSHGSNIIVQVKLTPLRPYGLSRLTLYAPFLFGKHICICIFYHSFIYKQIQSKSMVSTVWNAKLCHQLHLFVKSWFLNEMVTMFNWICARKVANDEDMTKSSRKSPIKDRSAFGQQSLPRLQPASHLQIGYP